MTSAIGQIDYTNAWPIFRFFYPDPKQFEVYRDVPSALNKKMQHNQLALSPVSSFSYGQNFKKYEIIPNLSISAKGEVKSLLLFVKNSLKEALKGTIALTTTSATTIHLLQIIVKEFMGAEPTYVHTAPDLNQMFEKADAGLLIGDHAIQARMTHASYTYYDIGALWHHYTKEWMTYAVFVAPKARIQMYQEIVSELYRSKQKGITSFELLAKEACAKYKGGYDFWLQYFQGLTYDLKDEQIQGLNRYFYYCKKMGFLDEQPRIRWKNENFRDL